jgi:hypothetical protein
MRRKGGDQEVREPPTKKTHRENDKKRGGIKEVEKTHKKEV